MNKKITQFKWLVTMLLLVTAMVMPSVAWALKQPKGEGTEANPYQISNYSELYWFAEHVNAGNTTACAELTADIYAYGEWTPIGSYPYEGTFDGQGHTISGLRFSSDTSDSGPWGFFLGTETNSVIRNVGIVNSSFNGWMSAACAELIAEPSRTAISQVQSVVVKGSAACAEVITEPSRTAITTVLLAAVQLVTTTCTAACAE